MYSTNHSQQTSTFFFVLHKNVDLTWPNTFYLNQAKKQLLIFHSAQEKAMSSVSVGQLTLLCWAIPDFIPWKVIDLCINMCTIHYMKNRSIWNALSILRCQLSPNSSIVSMQSHSKIQVKDIYNLNFYSIIEVDKQILKYLLKCKRVK